MVTSADDAPSGRAAQQLRCCRPFNRLTPEQATALEPQLLTRHY